ncbi:Radical SAM domain protein [Anaeromyxobacter dehalogenans 2CP-1]|uniref:Radical SAM domain protein n=1 Tax=Anaeromyxobacter dehalogenans (strain ATCC BAA-258 / DSM 21875 / 2CP-1) TaxID=455488 RepID=B8J7V1_ANAD2|nr:YgiQ family radical SAM protein [Anaeromyxobacter dehalogenans]ACL63443.1 Radical SAM domain protein [Anaeromyxobacter dehalogenans 2CP-1]
MARLPVLQGDRARRPAPPGPEAFLPMFPEHLRARGWADLDVLLVSGDAYVDHPSFGAAVIGRVLEAAGYKVGVVAQPDWRSPAELLRLGRPRLFVGITSGAMDSMVNHYTAHKRRRSEDAYTPDGAAGRRPDRATTVYARLARAAFGATTPIVLGGIEASLRRIAHYDYWDDRVLPSVLVPSGADLLVYGQGEKPILEIARRLASGEDICGLTDVPGTALAVPDLGMAMLDGRDRKVLELPAYEEIVLDKRRFAEFSRLYHLEHNEANARILVQRHGRGPAQRHVVVNPPMRPPSTEELDRIAELPYVREAHPAYGGAHIPALEQIRWSVQILRGCAAGCAFCCITEHQGRDIASRSEASVLREIATLASKDSFRGTITDVGGATANMWRMECTSAAAHAACRRASCVYPSVCQFFSVDHGPLVDLYEKARKVPGVKHVFVGSGVRYDLAQADEKNGARYLEALVANHVSGQLKVAPEHVCEPVLKVMKKPGVESFERFRKDFERYTRKAGKEQYLVPYFISSHPGASLEEAADLMEYLQANRWKPQQVQDFMPTPMTLASDIFWSGYHPMTGKPVHVTRDMEEKRMQKALLRWGDPANRPLIEKALRKIGRLRPGERLGPGMRPGRRGAGRPGPGARGGAGPGRGPR